ncbi:hypothetical protein CR513_53184, partial [Mucuna pruriens]
MNFHKSGIKARWFKGCSTCQNNGGENKGKKDKSKEKDDDNDRITTAIGDDLVIRRDFESINLMANHGVTKVIGAGDVCLQTNMGMQLRLREVKHAPDVHFNLISMHMLDDGGLKNAELGKCSHCIAGKQTRVSFKKNRVSFKKHPPLRKSKLLELVHSDVCGPLKEALVYVFKTKDQVLEKFKQFQALVERQLGKKVKCIHFNNGGEYCGPFDAFVHVPKDERSKLDMKTRQCIFIGYSHDEYGYRMYDLIEKKLVKSRDVQYMENQTIEDINKVKKTTSEKDNSFSEIDPVQMLVYDMDIANNNVQNGEQHNYLEDGFDVPPDDDVEKEQEISQDKNMGDASRSPPVQLRMPNRQRQSSIKYTFDEYMTLTDGEEPEYIDLEILTR